MSVWAGAKTASYPVMPFVGYSDYNLFFGGQSEGGENWTKWQKKGFDLNSVIADPPARDDYRLNPESPAFKLGFQPIDVTKIGIRHKER